MRAAKAQTSMWNNHLASTCLEQADLVLSNTYLNTYASLNKVNEHDMSQNIR